MPNKPLKNVSILLVEDNEMNTLLASAILQRIGANITEVDNGMEAVNLLKKQSFDVILMDLHLPVMNGFETTKYIRNTLQLNIPIIAITANVVNGEEKKCLEAGMNAFISKPYTEKNLVEKINNCISNQTQSTTQVANTEKPETTDLYDLTPLRKICNGSQQLISDMLRTFIKQVPETMKDIRLAYQQRNFEALFAAAHNIKPNIDMLEISSLKNHIREIERFAGEQKNGSELLGLIDVLDMVLIKVVENLKAKELA